MARDDIWHIIDTQLGTANYLLPTESERAISNRVFYDNNSIWQAILYERIRAYNIITLNSFFLFEWFPRSPGLYFTSAGNQARERARSLIETTDHGVVVYNPYGKMSMLRGGVGNIRLKPREITDEPIWFLSASSNGICHEGFPIALPQHFYEQYIDEITSSGAVVCTLVGKLKFIPKPLITLYEDYRAVPQLYLLVEDVLPPETPKSSETTNIKISVAISFLSEYEGSEKLYASYVNFNPAIKGSFDQNVEWMEETYVKSNYKGRIVTDFDEQMSRFPNAPFSLKKNHG